MVCLMGLLVLQCLLGSPIPNHGMTVILLLLTPEFRTCAPKQWLPIFLFSERKVCHSSVMVTMADKLSDKEVSALRLALSTQDALPGSEYTHCMHQWSYMVKYISSLTASACRPLTFTVDRVMIRLGVILLPCAYCWSSLKKYQNVVYFSSNLN